MNLYKEIGGYFQLELEKRKLPNHLEKCYFVNSGRTALELVLRQLEKISKIYIPYYSCDVILEPINRLNIEYQFYHIDEKLEIVDCIDLQEDEHILYTNYFGIKDNYVLGLDAKFGQQLIADCAQALFFDKAIKGSIIYSPRKFAGIPDGGIAAINNKTMNMSQYEKDVSCNRFSHLIKRIDLGANAGFPDFKNNADNLKGQAIKQISNLTFSMINTINFEHIKFTRVENFSYLHSQLKNTNQLKIDSFGEFSCPMVYPYLTNDNSLRKRLIDNKIFVATYWQNIFEWCKESELEYRLAKKIIPIPVDQRYGIEEMEYIISIIQK